MSRPSDSPLVIEASEAVALSHPLLGRHLDLPAAGQLEGELLISGWAVSAEGPLDAVTVSADGSRVARVRADRPRRDIAEAFPDCAHAASTGFRVLIPSDVAGCVAQLEIAVERDGEPAQPIWQVRLGRPSLPSSAFLDEPFRVVALISSYNEADMIESVLEHLFENGIWSYLIDDRSTDDTVARAQRWLGRGLLGIEQLTREQGASTAWRELLTRKLDLAEMLGADWYIHHDADEIRESPWPGVSLRDAIRSADCLGYNAIDFRVLNFPPVDDTFRVGDDPRRHFTRFEEPAEYDRTQRKCWKAGFPEVRLEDGGHDVRFPGRRLFPVRFLLRHYPIRSQAHGRRKVWRERKNRFAAEEIQFGWHRQYDHVTEPDHVFLRSPASLKPFDLDRLRLDTVLEDGRLVVEDLCDELTTADARGVLESVTPETISGWAARGDDAAASVELWDGARLLATAPAERPRADLVARGIAGGGFALHTPRELLDGQPHWIWATVAGTPFALRRSPIVLHHGGRMSIAPPAEAVAG